MEQAGAKHLRAAPYTHAPNGAILCYTLKRRPTSSVRTGHTLILEDDRLSILAIVDIGQVHHFEQQWVVFEATTVYCDLTVCGVVVPPQPNCQVNVPFKSSRLSLWRTVEYHLRRRTLPSTLLRAG